MQKLRSSANRLFRPLTSTRGRSVFGLLLRVAIIVVAVTALVLLSMPHGDGGPASVEIEGQEETVFDWSRDACEPIDIPDTPVRAFRDASGRVQMVGSSYVNRRLIGPDLDHLRHPCEVVLPSDFNPDPAAFSDREWITSTYTVDGRTVFAIVHDEYWGHMHPGRCSSREYHPCWYNVITYAVSTDGGRTYRQPPAPSHLVAALPYTYAPGTGPYGLFQPSNIVKNADDGYFYILVRAQPYKEQKPGVCVLRTRDLSRPDSWLAWGGSSFDVRFVNPYVPGGAGSVPGNHLCTPVDNSDINGMTQSLTYSTYFDQFILVGTKGDRGLESGGIYFSLSKDLIHWRRARLIRRGELVYTWKCGDEDPVMHPSLLDPESRSRNFDTVGREAYLYYVRIGYDDCQQTLDRDLLRVKVRFSK